MKGHNSTVTEKHFWYGLTDMNKTGTFVWVHGGQSAAKFTELWHHWHSGQPDKPGEEHCIVDYYPDNYGLQDVPCTWKQAFVCQQRQETGKILGDIDIDAVNMVQYSKTVNKKSLNHRKRSCFPPQ